ncbi:MAG: tRNA(His) guanylyltransferase Thg1 family protein [Pseudomonadota bacterium]
MTKAAAEELDARMRALECFTPLRLLPGAWVVVRVDGHGFHRFTEGRFERPFDERLRDFMVVTARTLLEVFHGVYAYTMSDEISILLAPQWDEFARRLEKIVSLAAGLASATFTHACGEPAYFDGRVWLGPGEAQALDYFHWRQSDAARNALSAWCYWTLREGGAGAADAARALDGCESRAMREMLLRHGIDFDQLPSWQRQGVGLYWQSYEKRGHDPVANREVMAIRRRIVTEFFLPSGADCAALLQRVMAEAERERSDKDSRAR